MPLYEYKCSSCAHTFERIVKFSDAPIKTCPKCHKDTVEQLLSAPAIQFKGSGWYVSDYSRKNAAGTAPSSNSTESGASKPSESAPATGPSSASSDSGSTASGGSSTSTNGSSSTTK